MKVFITGGSGYLGRATIRALVADGHDVLALARSESPRAPSPNSARRPFKGELRHLDVLRAAAAQADASIQLAQEWSPDGAELDRAAAGAMFGGAGDKPYVHTGGTGCGATAAASSMRMRRGHRRPAGMAGREPSVRARARRPSVFVLPAWFWGHRGGLLESLFVTPARARGVVHYVGDGTGHCALAHVDEHRPALRRCAARARGPHLRRRR